MADTATTADSSADMAHADIGLVCALAIETAPLLAKCQRVKKYTGGRFVFRGGLYDDIRVAVVQSGPGFAPARKATRAMIDGHSPAWVISTGFCGGLRPDMRVGDIVLANSLVDRHGQEIKLDPGMAADPKKGLFVGRMVTADAIVRRVEDKVALAEKHDALAVDLESLAVAQVCAETGTRFMAVRVVSDDLSRDLPPEILSVLGKTGSVRFGAAVGSIFKRPGSVKDMWKLRESAHAAAERLATFLDGVLVQLHAAR